MLSQIDAQDPADAMFASDKTVFNCHIGRVTLSSAAVEHACKKGTKEHVQMMQNSLRFHAIVLSIELIIDHY